MNRYHFIALFCSLPLWLHSQSEMPQSDSLPRRRVEMGLNITNTLGNFFGNTDQNPLVDPYLIVLRIGSPKIRLRMGFGGRFNDSDDSDGGNFRQTKQVDINARIGLENVQNVTRRFAYFWGGDLVLARQYERINTFLSGGRADLRTEVYEFGAGPVFGVLFRLHPKVMLLTESSLYGLGRAGQRSVEAPPDVRKSNISGFRIRAVVPTSLFVNFVF